MFLKISRLGLMCAALLSLGACATDVQDMMDKTGKKISDAYKDTFYGYSYYSQLNKRPAASWKPNAKKVTVRPPERTESISNYQVGQPYRIGNKWYYPAENDNYREKGVASWYGAEFHNRKTANGERFDKNAFTAAHRTLPMPSIARVTNLENGKSVRVRVNDRGPFKRDRVIDVSKAAAVELGFLQKGMARVMVEFDPEATAKLFHDPVDEDIYPSRPKTTTARHRTSPNEPITRRNFSKRQIYYIQTGAYESADDATKVMDKLGDIAEGVVLQEIPYKGKTMFKVKVGPFMGIKDAEVGLEKVQRLGFSDAIIDYK